MLRKFGLTFLCGLLLSAAAFATDFPVPEQTIVGADAQIEEGELVTLTMSPVKVKPKYYAGVSYNWLVLEGMPQFDPKTNAYAGFDFKQKKIAPYEDGVFFGAGIGYHKLRVVVAVTHSYVVKDDKGVVTEVGSRTVLYTSDVVVGRPKPTPPPTPPAPPTPDPDPTFADGAYKLAKTIFDLAKKVPAGDAKAKAAQALAASYEGIASAIAAGTLKDPTDILKKTTASNDAALSGAGGARADWLPTFEGLQDVVFDLWQNKKINSADDFRTAWLELAAGLKKVK